MGQPTAQTSGLLAAGTTTLASGISILDGYTVLTDGTNAATLTIYDNTAGSGTVLAKLIVPGATNFGHVPLPWHVRALTGITAVLSGTGSGAVIYFGA